MREGGWHGAELVQGARYGLSLTTTQGVLDGVRREVLVFMGGFAQGGEPRHMRMRAEACETLAAPRTSCLASNSGASRTYARAPMRMASLPSRRRSAAALSGLSMATVITTVPSPRARLAGACALSPHPHTHPELAARSSLADQITLRYPLSFLTPAGELNARAPGPLFI
jgi:hypothetical protein